MFVAVQPQGGLATGKAALATEAQPVHRPHFPHGLLPLFQGLRHVYYACFFPSSPEGSIGAQVFAASGYNAVLPSYLVLVSPTVSVWPRYSVAG